MTMEEAIKILEGLAVPVGAESAFDMAIQALKDIEDGKYIELDDDLEELMMAVWG